MELRHLRYFVAVAEELNFTRAAERLGISQPPLSLQIRQLEKELGTPLFHRRARSVELTDAGRLLLEEARVILKQVQTAKSGVRRRGRGETGRIVVGSAGATYFHAIIPEIIREYGMRYPDIILAPQASNTALLVARLRAGQVDIALIRPPIDNVEGLTIEPLVARRRRKSCPSSRWSPPVLAYRSCHDPPLESCPMRFAIVLSREIRRARRSAWHIAAMAALAPCRILLP